MPVNVNKQLLRQILERDARTLAVCSNFFDAFVVRVNSTPLCIDVILLLEVKVLAFIHKAIELGSI